MNPGGMPDPSSLPPPQDPYDTGQGFPPPPPTPYPAYPPPHPQPQPFYPPPATPARSTTPHVLLLAVAAVSIVGMMIVGGVAIWVVSRPGPPTPSPTALATSTPPTAPYGPADAVDGLTVGRGPVKVDVYVDYQCPPCSSFERLTADSLTGYLTSDRVTLSIHPVAFVDRRSTNEYSTRSAAAMACAHEQGKTLEFHSYLLRHQPDEDTAGPTDRELAIAGHALGLGSAWDRCVTTGARLNWVDDATAAANANGIRSVPALLVDDRTVKATRSDLVTAVDRAR